MYYEPQRSPLPAALTIETWAADPAAKEIETKDGRNTPICFTSDHGDLLDDHHGWQKECYFEGACHISFLVSWPAQIPTEQRRGDLVCLTDLFGIATHAAGRTQVREGTDVLGVIKGESARRDCLFGYYGEPGTAQFKIMARHGDWKYIFMANGGREQLFDLKTDPHELKNLVATGVEVAAQLRAQAASCCDRPDLQAALDNSRLRSFPFLARPLIRIYQFDASKGVTGGFPKQPEDVLDGAK
jgi:choline-sulfatase